MKADRGKMEILNAFREKKMNLMNLVQKKDYLEFNVQKRKFQKFCEELEQVWATSGPRTNMLKIKQNLISHKNNLKVKYHLGF
jgi:hypothetical protein